MLYLQRAVIALSTLFPIAAFAVPNGKGWGLGFYLLLLCSLIGIAFRLKPMGKGFVQLLKEYWPISLAMSGLLLATFANELSRPGFSVNVLEWPFHLASFPLLFWVLLLVPEQNLKRISWAMAGGAIFCVAALYIESAGGTERPLFVLEIPLIPFANMAMLMGILVLFSLGWNSKQDKLSIVLKLIAGAVALYGSYLSQARGGWLAIPLFIGLALAVFHTVHIRHKLGSVLAVMVLLGGFYFFNHTIQDRIAAARSDIQQFIDGSDKDTSLGQRLQNWHGGWMLFKANPVLGIGREQYPEAIEKLAKQQVLSPIAAAQPHSHNDILFQMVALGIFGLLATVSLYFVPAYYFFREIRHPDLEARTIAGMGLALTLGFFVFGLSDTMFYWKVSYMFYAILLAVLFACLEKWKAKSKE